MHVAYSSIGVKFNVTFEMVYQYFIHTMLNIKRRKCQKKVVDKEPFLTSIHIYFIFFWYFDAFFIETLRYVLFCVG